MSETKRNNDNSDDAHSHNHQYSHHHHHLGDVDDGQSNFKWAFYLNIAFTIIEFIGGIMTNSIAILSDAIHDLGDTIAIGSSLALEKYSYKERDKKFSYGYRRFSPLAALINTVILVIGSIIIIYESVPRLFNPQEVDAQGMLYLAILGVAFNGYAVFRMKKSSGANQRVVMLHLLEDVLGWTAVLIGSIVIKFTGWYVVDPILSLSVAFYILFGAFKNFYQVSGIFLQKTPIGFSEEDLTESLLKISGINQVHDLHIWTLDGEYNIVTVHIVVCDNTSLDEIVEIKSQARELISHAGHKHYTIEIEFDCENCDFEDC